MTSSRTVVLMAALALCACNREPAAPAGATPGPGTPAAAPAASAPWALKVEPLTLSVGPGSSEAQLTVSEKGPLVSWVEVGDENTSLKFAERTATGWSAPMVAATGADWFINDSDVPSVL